MKQENERWFVPEFWSIDCIGGVQHIINLDEVLSEHQRRLKEFGNFFESKEEAENARDAIKELLKTLKKDFREPPYNKIDYYNKGFLAGVEYSNKCYKEAIFNLLTIK